MSSAVELEDAVALMELGALRAPKLLIFSNLPAQPPANDVLRGHAEVPRTLGSSPEEARLIIESLFLYYDM